MVLAWSAALDSHDVDALPGLYADPVRFYGQWLPRSAVMAAKRAALSGKSSFRQRVVGEISVTPHDDAVTAAFLKRSGANEKPRDVRARLGLRRNESGRLVISEETDDASEKHAGTHATTPDPSAGSAASTSATPARPACIGTGKSPYGCDFETEACVGGACQTCALGTRAMMTECMRGCRADEDCPRHEICNFIAGDVYVCTKPAPPKACPSGQIFIKSDGECWKTCTTRADCPEDMCCRSDFNSPSPICMGRCWDLAE